MNISERMKISDWVQALQPGDEVLASRWRGFSGSRSEIHKVAKLTATQVVLENGWRYDRVRNVGRLLDSNMNGEILPVTQEVRETFEREGLGAWLHSVAAGPSNGWKHPPLHVLRAMKAAHDKAVAGTPVDKP